MFKPHAIDFIIICRLYIVRQLNLFTYIVVYCYPHIFRYRSLYKHLFSQSSPHAHTSLSPVFVLVSYPQLADSSLCSQLSLYAHTLYGIVEYIRSLLLLVLFSLTQLVIPACIVCCLFTVCIIILLPSSFFVLLLCNCIVRISIFKLSRIVHIIHL